MPLATPEELAKYPPPPLPGWIRHPEKYGFPDWKGGALLPNPEAQIQFKRPASKSGKPGETYFWSNAGPQTWALMAPYQEILAGGSRGGGKSAMLIAWMVMGYPFLDKSDPAHYMSILEPSFRGLLLRKEYKSMAEFVDECWDFFQPLGAIRRDDPAVFTFKSGAKIYTSHLGDKNAFEQFRGWGLSRIGIEELTQIEDPSVYRKLLGSLRGKKQVRVHHTMYGRKQFPALPSQIMSTTNPDGPGAFWVKKRFIKVLDGQGKPVGWNRPMRDPISKSTRIFIPMARKENPYLRDNAEYESMLMSQDEVTQRQWRLGDWDAAAGKYFTEFRPDGPVTEEERAKYPWARHVITPAELKPWWYRFGGGDWGFDHPAAFHKFCKSEKDGRIHVYDELVLRRHGSFEVGVKLANWWLPDLEYLPDKTVTIALSSDAFSVHDDVRTKAEQMAEGIRSILGPYGAFLLKYTDDERQAMAKDPSYAARMFANHRSKADGQFVIALKPASKDTVARWSYMRELLRFRPIVLETQQQLEERLTRTFGRGGEDAYEKELAKVKRTEEGNLPRLQIWKKCSGLIRCIEEANKDEDNPEKIKKFNAVDGLNGDDEIESCGHGLHHFKEIEKVMPKSYYLSDKMEAIQGDYEKGQGERLTDPTRLIMVQLTQAHKYDVAHPANSGSFNLPRASSSRHRIRQPNQHGPF